MRSKTNTIGLMLALSMSAVLMIGCASGRIAVSCPMLAAPPASAVDALQSAGDSAVDAWVIALDRHYTKLDACNR